MHEIIIALNATNAAFIAVIIISLNTVVKEVAHGAKIGGKLNATPFI
jgi:recombinational DNA repair protein RecR